MAPRNRKHAKPVARRRSENARRGRRESAAPPRPSRSRSGGTGGTLLLTAAVVSLHVLLVFHGGGLWRDEVNTVNLATAPSLGHSTTRVAFPASRLDGFDLHIKVPAVIFREIADDCTSEASAQIRKRVVSARRRQHERFKHKPKIICNARVGARVEIILRTGRTNKGIAQERDGRFEFERPRLRPDFEGGADNCRPGRLGKNSERPCFGGD